MCSGAFSDGDVSHVEGEVDPIRDMEIIHHELRLKDEEFLKKHLDALESAIKRLGKTNLDKNKIVELDTIKKALKLVAEDKQDIRVVEWNSKEIEFLNPLTLLTAKPVIYLVNVSEKDFIRRKNKWLAKIKAWIDKNATATNPEDTNDIYSRPAIIPFSCKMEHQLSVLTDAAEKQEYLVKLGESFADEVDGKTTVPDIKSILPKIVTTGYQALQLGYYFTAGADEVRAWTIRRGTKSPQAAGVM